VRIIAFMLMGLVLLSAISCRQESNASSITDIQQTLDSLEARLAWTDYRLSQEQWDYYTTGLADSLQFFQGVSWSLLSDEDLLNALRRVHRSENDQISKRRIELILPRVAVTTIDDMPGIKRLRDSLLVAISLESTDSLHDLIIHGSSRTHREQAYRDLCSVDASSISQFSRLFRMRNQAASRMGYRDYYSLMSSLCSSSEQDNFQLVEQIDSLTRSAYERMLEGRRNSGSSETLEVWNWWQPYASTLREVDRFFPVDSQLYLVKRSLADIGFRLEQLPIYLSVSSDSSASPMAQTIVVQAPCDVRLVVNLSDGFQSTRRLFHAVGLALLHVQVRQDSHWFSNVVDPVWSNAVGLFFEQLCLQPDWLSEYAALPSDLIARLGEAEEANHLLQLRLNLVDIMFEYEAYKNPNRDLNSMYWDVFTRYTMLPRHDDLTPWATQLEYVTMPLGRRAQLLSRTAMAQTYVYLYDNYSRVVGNDEVKSFLTQNYFRFGSRYHWCNLLERTTGEPLSYEHLVH